MNASQEKIGLTLRRQPEASLGEQKASFKARRRKSQGGIPCSLECFIHVAVSHILSVASRLGNARPNSLAKTGHVRTLTARESVVLNRFTFSWSTSTSEMKPSLEDMQVQKQKGRNWDVRW